MVHWTLDLVLRSSKYLIILQGIQGRTRFLIKLQDHTTHTSTVVARIYWTECRILSTFLNKEMLLRIFQFVIVLTDKCLKSLRYYFRNKLFTNYTFLKEMNEDDNLSTFFWLPLLHDYKEYKKELQTYFLKSRFVFLKIKFTFFYINLRWILIDIWRKSRNNNFFSDRIHFLTKKHIYSYRNSKYSVLW